MKKLVILMLSALLGVMAVAAQTRPTVVVFEASNTETMTMDAIDAGEAEITLSWFVSSLGNNQSLRLDAYRMTGWERVFPATDVLLANDERTLTVQPTLNFNPPTYRLVVVDAATQQIVAERLLTVPYTTPESDPHISVFEGTGVRNFTDANISQGNARVDVSWVIENRVPGSNLIFDQVLPNNTAVTVELPRENLWVSSAGAGAVAPRPSTDGQIRIRLSLVDIRTNTAYDQAFITIAADGTITSERVAAAGQSTEVLQPTNTTPPATSTERQPVDCATVTPANAIFLGYPGDGCNTITDSATGQTISVDEFSSTATLAVPGENVPLTWAVSGAQSALIELYSLSDLEGSTVAPSFLLYENLPTSSSAAITIPAEYTSGARLILWAANPNPSGNFARLTYAILDLPVTADQVINIGGQQTQSAAPVTTDQTTSTTDGEIPPEPSATSIVFASYQPFESGAMFYRDDFKEVTILYADGRAEYYPQARYRDLEDNTQLFPPEGLFSPLGRFGKLWANIETIQTELGWGTAIEQSYQANVERISAAEGISFRIQLPDGTNILLDGDSWEVAQ